MSSLSPSSGQFVQLRNSYRRQSDRLDKSLERLSTGKRINRPSDDPSGFVAAEEIRGEIVRMSGELKRINSQRNVKRIEQSGLAAIQDRLIELRGMLTEAAGSVLTGEQKEVYDAQIDDSLQAIEQIKARTNELAAKYGGAPTRASATNRTTAASQGIEQLAQYVDGQADSAAFSRAAEAAYEKYQLDVPAQLLEESIAIHAEALSQIEDTDFVEETSNLAAAQILSQAALAAIKVGSKSFADQMTALLESASDVDAATELGDSTGE